MRTRIRHFRKIKGLTLRQLADRVGTTPQTVQRLETANMTVSTDWLEKIAGALEVRAVELLDDGRTPGIPRLGVAGRGDRVALSGDDDRIEIDVPADNPVAIEITNPTGGYSAGSILIGNRYSSENIDNSAGRDSIVGLRDGTVMLRRVIRLPDGQGYSLMPLDSGGDAIHGAEIEWAAPIIMAINYL